MSDSAALRGWRRRAAEGSSRGWRPSTRVVFAATAGMLLLCAVLGRGALNGESAPTRTPGAPTAPRETGKTRGPCPPVATGLHADVDGDGCDDEIAFAGGLLTAGRLRIQVGAPGDQVTLGRWTCGEAAVGLLRPSTGEVFRFDGWPRRADPVSAVALGRVGDAVDVRAAPRNGGPCDDLVVVRSSGPPVLLPERPVAG